MLILEHPLQNYIQKILTKEVCVCAVNLRMAHFKELFINLSWPRYCVFLKRHRKMPTPLQTFLLLLKRWARLLLRVMKLHTEWNNFICVFLNIFHDFCALYWLFLIRSALRSPWKWYSLFCPNQVIRGLITDQLICIITSYHLSICFDQIRKMHQKIASKKDGSKGRLPC